MNISFVKFILCFDLTKQLSSLEIDRFVLTNTIGFFGGDI